MIKRTLIVAAAAIALAAAARTAPAPAQMAMAMKNPIAIQSCTIMSPMHFSKKPRGTAITFVNHASKTATSITFAVGYRNSASNFLRRVTDVGSFAPGQVIKHTYSLYNDITYAGAQTHGCAAVAITWADGSKWKM